jgi:Trk K+ transport system NAD-binding subunit
MLETVIVCGLGRIGWRVLDYLRDAGLKVTAIDTRATAADARLQGIRLVLGDCRRQEVLQEAGAAGVDGVLIMTNDDLVNISTALEVRRLNATCRIVLRLFNENLITRLGKTLANVFALSTSNLSAPLFALSAISGQALGQIQIGRGPDKSRLIGHFPVGFDSPLAGRTIGQAAAELLTQVVGHVPAGPIPGLVLNPEPDTTLRGGDRLILVGPPDRLTGILEGLGTARSSVLWAGWLRRTWRVVRRTMLEVDVAVKICGAVLAAVVLTSTIILNFGVNRYRNWADAFFRTISLMATGGDMHMEDFDQNWQKIFASILRISGAALTAAFTAIVTNYLLRARLAGALEIRRVPESGHVIVCGLGNIGFRVVETLVGLGRRVVVIEDSRDSRFVTTVRRLGVPVLIGDATVNQVLEQARIGRAKALIAATSLDLVNLEISLTARETNPKLRVVLHLQDPDMAEGLQEAANMLVAVSIPTLSAPAFVAALFGDRVKGVFLVENRLLTALDLVVPEADPLVSMQSLRALAIDYGIAPIALTGPNGEELELLDKVLTPGSRLVALLDLVDLERFLRRDPIPRDYQVDVLEAPAGGFDALHELVPGSTRARAADEATALPWCLARNLTRGQAEVLLGRLAHKQVAARSFKSE